MTVNAALMGRKKTRPTAAPGRAPAIPQKSNSLERPTARIKFHDETAIGRISHEKEIPLGRRSFGRFGKWTARRKPGPPIRPDSRSTDPTDGHPPQSHYGGPW